MKFVLKLLQILCWSPFIIITFIGIILCMLTYYLVWFFYILNEIINKLLDKFFKIIDKLRKF